MSESNEYSAPKGVKFLLCDEVRLEQNGKLLVIGLYPGEQVVVHAAPSAQGGIVLVPSLSFVFLIRGGEGTVSTRVIIEAPDSKVVFDESTGEVKLSSFGTHTLAPNLRPFAVGAFGEYSVQLSLNQKIYSFSCEIRQPQSAEKPLLAQGVQKPRGKAARKK